MHCKSTDMQQKGDWSKVLKNTVFFASMGGGGGLPGQLQFGNHPPSLWHSDVEKGLGKLASP